MDKLWISCGKKLLRPLTDWKFGWFGNGGYGRMLGKILPGLLLLLLATTALSVHPNVVEAASNECKAKPDVVAPVGSHWYYRVQSG